MLGSIRPPQRPCHGSRREGWAATATLVQKRLPVIRNSVSLLVAPLLLWMPFPVECAERNLVPDSSFEEPRILEAWSVQEPAGTSVRLDRTVARTGKSSLCIETLPGHEEDTYPAVKFRVRPSRANATGPKYGSRAVQEPAWRVHRAGNDARRTTIRASSTATSRDPRPTAGSKQAPQRSSRRAPRDCHWGWSRTGRAGPGSTT